MHYMPILKPKHAEFQAFEGTKSSMLYPLIDLTGARPAEAGRPAQDGRLARPPKPAQLMTDHLNEVHKRISEYWGSEPILVDPYLFLHRHPDGLQTLLSELDEWRKDDIRVRIIPVLRVNTRPAVTTALGEMAREQGNGIGIRLTRNDLLRTDTAEDVKGLLAITRISAQATDIILDAGGLADQDLEALIVHTVKVVSAIAADRFRSITVAATGFSGNLQENAGKIARLELAFWNGVQAQVDIPVQFGDYGVDVPASAVDPAYVERGMVMPTVVLRYTYSDHWLFLKEPSPRVLNPETGRTSIQRGSFKHLCERLIASPQFLGADFSPGDQYFWNMAAGHFANDGTSTAWRLAAFSHHFAFIQSQLQEDDDPGAIDADDELPF